MPNEIQVLALSADGAIQRLALCIEDLARQDAAETPEWLNAAGRVSVYARDIEDVPILLVRLAEYVQRLRHAGCEFGTEIIRGEPMDKGDIFAAHIIRGESFFGARHADTPQQFVHPTIKDLRNAIEHHSDYVAGIGNKPELVHDVRATAAYTCTLDPFELREILLFDVEYEVGGAVEMAWGLKAALEQIAQV